MTTKLTYLFELTDQNQLTYIYAGPIDLVIICFKTVLVTHY